MHTAPFRDQSPFVNEAMVKRSHSCDDARSALPRVELPDVKLSAVNELLTLLRVSEQVAYATYGEATATMAQLRVVLMHLTELTLLLSVSDERGFVDDQ